MLSTLCSFLPHMLIGAGGLGVIIHAVVERETPGSFWKRVTSWPTCCEFFSGLAIVIGTFWLAIQQADFEKDLTSKITGGNSYCFLKFENYKGGTNQVDVLLQCKGEYPVFDLVVELNDWEKVRQATQLLIDTQPTKSMIEAARFASKDTLIRNMGTVLPTTNGARIFEVLNLPAGGIQRYFVSITARNGTISQFVRFRKVAGGWAKAERVLRDKDVIQEVIDADFPKDAGGTINWKD